MLKPSADDFYEMTAERRELYLRVLDGFNPVHTIAQRLHFLEDHFPQEKIDPAMKWLVSHRLTGRHFNAWFSGPCKSSDLEMHRILLRIVDNEKLGPVVAGKNFRI